MNWNSADVAIEISDVEGVVMVVSITTPDGTIEMIGAVSRVGRTLYVRGAHIQGARAGALGRGGLNAIGRKLMVEADVDELVIEGGTRTTGRAKGRAPRIIRFPR